MNEKATANKLDNIFSDSRINPIYLAMVTREMFGRQTNDLAGQWWAYHCIDLDARLRGIDLGDYDIPNK